MAHPCVSFSSFVYFCHSMAKSSLHHGVAIGVEPILAYRGRVAEWARDYEICNPFYTFWFIESGSVRIDWEGGSRRVGAGFGVLIPAGLKRWQHFSAEVLVRSLSFRATLDDGRRVFPWTVPLVPGRKDGIDLASLAQRIIGRNTSSGRRSLDELSSADRLVVHGALEMFVGELIQWGERSGLPLMESIAADARLVAILRDLNSGLRAGPLPFDHWRKETGLGRVQIDRIAKDALGMSLRAYRDELLLTEIRSSLVAGRESLKETAARLGFFDAAHFNRWVRQRTGTNPKDLREAWV